MNSEYGTVQVGSDQAHTHQLEEVRAHFNLRGQTEQSEGTVHLLVGRSDKCIRLWLSPEGVMYLLARLLGALPIFTEINKEVADFCRIILMRYDKVSYVVQSSYRDLPEEVRGWRDICSSFSNAGLAHKAVAEHEQSNIVEPGAIFRVIERRERVIPKP